MFNTISRIVNTLRGRNKDYGACWNCGTPFTSADPTGTDHVCP